MFLRIFSACDFRRREGSLDRYREPISSEPRGGDRPELRSRQARSLEERELRSRLQQRAPYGDARFEFDILFK